MSRFLFLHGAMRGAWLWDRLLPFLGPSNRNAIAYELPGHASRYNERDKVNMSVYVQDVLDHIKTNSLFNLILVGHSMSGIIISRLAEEVPDRIRHLVYLAAVVPGNGEALIDLLPEERQKQIRKWQGRVTEIHAPQDLCFTGLTGEPKELCLKRMTPQPMDAFFEKVVLDRFSSLTIPRTYVLGLNDKSLPPDRARGYAKRLGVVPIEIDGDHDMMMSRPAEVAKILLAVQQ